MKKLNRIYVFCFMLIACAVFSSCSKDSDGASCLKELEINGSEWETSDITEEKESAPTGPEVKERAAPAEEASVTVTVYVCGEVVRPGVYELSEGARIIDALIAAGGFTGEAADNYLNQAEMLTDGGKVYVPSKEELKEGGGLSASGAENGALSGSDSGLVNINKADKSQLMTISGVGEAKAEKIIAYREEFGGFAAIEDIMNIPGIKEGMFSKIKDQICVK